MRDLWCVGDTFLYDTFPTLVEMKHEVQVKQQAKPYIYDYFNVTGYMPNPISDLHSVLARILNALILGLSDVKKLPWILLAIPDQDILQYINYFEPGKSHVIGTALEWLVTNFEKAITCKKEDLHHQRAGAVAANEPKMLWVKMLKCSPNDASESSDQVDAVADTFNEILEKILATRRNAFVFDVNPQLHNGLVSYNAQGKLTANGKIKYWKIIDQTIEKFDR